MSSIDVIIPCYKYGHLLRASVRSVLDQSFENVRVLILDDASPDETEQVGRALASEDTRVTYVKHEANKGHIATYNEGIEWSTSTYFLLLSADDYLLPDAVGRAVSVLDANPRASFVFGAAVELSDDGATATIEPLSDWLGPRDHAVMTGREFIERSGCRNIVPTPTAFVRTGLQKAVGGYRADLPHAGDMEMWFRLALEGDVGVISAPLAVKRAHKHNMSHAYMARSRLADFQQRRAVVEALAEAGRGRMEGREALLRDMRRQLALEMLRSASGAFNDGDQTASQELARMAADTSPGARRSIDWLKLQLKCGLGAENWHRLCSSRLGRVLPLRRNSI